MRERSNRLKKPVKCAFIDLSSILSVLPLSLSAVYCATKIFNRIFTLGLSSYLSKPVARNSADISTEFDFLSVQPSVVETNMTKEAKSEMEKLNPADLKLFVTVDQCIEGSLAALGKLTMTPGAKGHGIQYFVVETLKGLLPEDFHSALMDHKYAPVDIKTVDSK